MVLNRYYYFSHGFGAKKYCKIYHHFPSSKSTHLCRKALFSTTKCIQLMDKMNADSFFEYCHHHLYRTLSLRVFWWFFYMKNFYTCPHLRNYGIYSLSWAYSFTHSSGDYRAWYFLENSRRYGYTLCMHSANRE